MDMPAVMIQLDELDKRNQRMLFWLYTALLAHWSKKRGFALCGI
ncbi:MAG: hypothetical protein ACI906_002922 [Candidatus Latescibacterota bacterium]|jgi:hypothetical protein